MRIKVYCLAYFVELLIHSLLFLQLMFCRHKLICVLEPLMTVDPHEEMWREQMRFTRGLPCENMLQKQLRDAHYIPQQSFKSILQTTELCLDISGQNKFSSEYLALLRSYIESPACICWQGRTNLGKFVRRFCNIPTYLNIDVGEL